MSNHYAVSLSASQGAYDVTANVCLIHADDHHETVINLTWPAMPPQPSPENAGEWLLGLLEALVTDFHSHIVYSTTRQPRTVHGGPKNG